MKLFTFWIGPLSYIERLCLTSMVAAGHDVDLFTYDNLDVPHGVTVRDAREVLPRENVFIHRRSGDPAPFADMFRYEGLRLGLGLWVDTDILVLRNLSGMGDHVFGFQNENLVCNAVLGLPPDCSFLTEVLDFARHPVIIHPDWRPMKKLRQRALSWIGMHKRIDELSRGIIGPPVLTRYVKKHGLKPLPPAVFYPLPWQRTDDLFDPRVRVEDFFTPETRAVHLWNKLLCEHKKSAPPRGSFIARMCDQLVYA